MLERSPAKKDLYARLWFENRLLSFSLVEPT